MCHERDRLIAYLYDECDARERDAVRDHLDGCDECRTEVAGLRSVREDLLAWDVPAHESVWKPFAVAAPRPWWRQVPAWAMAAAAAVVLVAGAGGGVAAHAFMPERASAIAPVDAQQPTTVALTAADLAALEQRLSSRVNEQVVALDARVQQVSTGSLRTEEFQGDRAALLAQIASLREQNDSLANVIKLIYANVDQLTKPLEFKNAELARNFNDLKTLVLTQLQQTQPSK